MPSTVVVLDALPVTSSGKLDRHALPDPDATRPALDNAYAAPHGEIERALAHIWQEVLGVGSVGVDDNFFDMGGHSLLLIRVHSRLVSQTALPPQSLTVVDLFKYPTIRALAAYLATSSPERHVEEPAAQQTDEPGESRRELLRRQRDFRRRARAGVTRD